MLFNSFSNASIIKEPDGNNGYPVKPITETIPNGFFTVDQKWTVRYWNKSAEKLLNISARDIVGTNLWDRFAGTVPTHIYDTYHAAGLEDIPVHFEEYWAEVGVWFEVNTYYCEDTLSVSFKRSNRQVIAGYPMHQKRRLKMLNDLYRFVLEVTNDCLWEWNLQTREIFWIDGGHKRVFGYQVENSLIPQNFWESRVHPDDKIRVLTRLNAVITSGSLPIWDDEYRFKKADGDYAYVSDRGHIIYNSDKVAVRMIGATQDITSRKSAENKLVQERLTKQKEITEAVLTAHENERSTIGKELHDNLNQILGAAKLFIDLAKTDEENRLMCLEKSSGFIVDVMEEIRKISKTLLTPGMVMGLTESIRLLLDDLIVIHPIKIVFRGTGVEEDKMDEKMKLDIFRIIQEQLNNILKHANASRAAIHLAGHEGKIILRISDNGQGCDSSKKKKGVGIMNIRGRVELYHGKVSIMTKPGKGYALKVILPLDKQVTEEIFPD